MWSWSVRQRIWLDDGGVQWAVQCGLVRVVVGSKLIDVCGTVSGGLHVSCGVDDGVGRSVSTWPVLDDGIGVVHGVPRWSVRWHKRFVVVRVQWSVCRWLLRQCSQHDVVELQWGVSRWVVLPGGYDEPCNAAVCRWAVLAGRSCRVQQLFCGPVRLDVGSD